MKVVDIVRPTTVWAPPMTYLTFSYMIIHVPAISSHHKPSETIKIIKKYYKHSQTITVIHSIPIYLNTTQYIAIYPTQGTKKLSTLHCPLLLGHFQVLLELLVQPGLLWVAGMCWPGMKCSEWCLSKIIKNIQKALQFHDIPCIFREFQGLWK